MKIIAQKISFLLLIGGIISQQLNHTGLENNKKYSNLVQNHVIHHVEDKGGRIPSIQGSKKYLNGQVISNEQFERILGVSDHRQQKNVHIPNDLMSLLGMKNQDVNNFMVVNGKNVPVSDNQIQNLSSNFRPGTVITEKITDKNGRSTEKVLTQNEISKIYNKDQMAKAMRNQLQNLQGNAAAAHVQYHQNKGQQTLNLQGSIPAQQQKVYQNQQQVQRQQLLNLQKLLSAQQQNQQQNQQQGQQVLNLQGFVPAPEQKVYQNQQQAQPVLNLQGFVPAPEQKVY
ncbi:MAG: hypothetical protein GY827_01455 [Cytophagales bacterium]|nr:hypothetical protein [Cytophagales bacterium]